MKIKYLFSLAFKNLTRYKRRTLITVMVLAIGIGVFIMMDSLLIGTRRESEINLIRYEMGNVKLVTADYWEEWKEMPLSSSIEDPQAVLDELESRGIDATARSVFRTNVVIPGGIGGNFPGVVYGIDMARDSQVFDLLDQVSEGRLPEAGVEEVLMGEWMAQDLELSLGDVLLLQVADRAGGNEVMEVEIVGLINTPNPQVNMMGIYAPLDTVDYYLYMEGTATEIILSYPMQGPLNKSGAVHAEEVAAMFDLEVHPWEDWSADYLAAADGDKYGSYIILMLVFVIAAVGFSNTLLMSLLERVPETGMMRAMGTTRGEIRRLFLLESTLQGFLGGITGCVIGALLNIPMVQQGIDISSMMRDFKMGYRISGIMYGSWEPTSFIIGIVSGLIIALAVSWFSIDRALKMKITDSVRAC